MSKRYRDEKVNENSRNLRIRLPRQNEYNNTMIDLLMIHPCANNPRDIKCITADNPFGFKQITAPYHNICFDFTKPFDSKEVNRWNRWHEIFPYKTSSYMKCHPASTMNPELLNKVKHIHTLALEAKTKYIYDPKTRFHLDDILNKNKNMPINILNIIQSYDTPDETIIHDVQHKTHIMNLDKHRTILDRILKRNIDEVHTTLRGDIGAQKRLGLL